MKAEMIREILLPFLGTTLGAACVFPVRKTLSRRMARALTGFAAGVMTAAAVWSLLIPAMEWTAVRGRTAFFPATIGLAAGAAFLMALDALVPRWTARGGGLKRSSMVALAVALHNLPEGMAVGAALAGMGLEGEGVSQAAALTLSLGIAIQNFPEGAIVAMPLRERGWSRFQAFAGGTLSGAVEPLGALLTLAAAQRLTPILPYLLGFAAGAMLYVVVEEMIPETARGARFAMGTALFLAGFALMMALDGYLG